MSIAKVIIGMCPFSLAIAATPVDLRHQPFSLAQSFIAIKSNTQTESLQPVKTIQDNKHTTHVRIKETYAGYPVWGGDAVLHIPQSPKQMAFANLVASAKPTTKMNGTIYQNLSEDLKNTPAYVFNTDQADKALQHAIKLYQEKTGVKQAAAKNKKQLMVFVDDKNKAHWAFLVSFMAQSAEHKTEAPTYILDALSFDTYKQWNNLQSEDLETVAGGGFGGRGWAPYMYDGYTFFSHLPSLEISRDEAEKICYMQNSNIIVRDARDQHAISHFACEESNAKHNNVYWNESFDSANQAFSPANDALYQAGQVLEVYSQVIETPMLKDPEGQAMMLNVHVHENMENAYWNDFDLDIHFGDGGDRFYPLVSLGIMAHELSHGFTSQNSGLVYEGQSGGLNESFSDMAAKAAEFVMNKQNNWTIGEEISKDGTALRYMNNPRLDCIGVPRGSMCSIDNAKNYSPILDVHYTSGVFNKAFYLLSTAPGWDPLKAFTVMTQANVRYWVPNTSFTEAACGVIDATRDFAPYIDVETVEKVMAQVGIDTSKC